MSTPATSHHRESTTSRLQLPSDTSALAAEALSESTQIQTWLGRQFGGLSVTRERSSGPGWSFILAWPHGRMTCWLGEAASPYLMSMLSCVSAQDPSWLNACLAQSAVLSVPGLVGAQVLSCVRDEAPYTVWLGWRFGPIQVLPLKCDPGLLQSWWLHAASAPDLESLPIAGRLVLHHRRWTRVQWGSLRCGDAVLIGTLHEKRIRGLCYWGLACEVGGWVDLNWETQEMSWISKVHGSIESPASGSGGHAGDAQAFEKIEIPVSFELDTVRISLAHLRQLHPGQIIPMAFPVHDGIVRLMSQGHCLAIGRLVEVEGHLAVCLTQLSDMSVGG